MTVVYWLGGGHCQCCHKTEWFLLVDWKEFRLSVESLDVSVMVSVEV